MTPTDPQVLIESGDWACAHSSAEGLAAVVGQLCPQVSEGERALLIEVERLAEIDMVRARALWNQVTRAMRERFFGSEPDDDRLR
jgi:hypothetical protein